MRALAPCINFSRLIFFRALALATSAQYCLVASISAVFSVSAAANGYPSLRICSAVSKIGLTLLAYLETAPTTPPPTAPMIPPYTTFETAVFMSFEGSYVNFAVISSEIPCHISSKVSSLMSAKSSPPHFRVAVFKASLARPICAMDSTPRGIMLARMYVVAALISAGSWAFMCASRSLNPCSLYAADASAYFPP